ncbi:MULTISPECIES: methyl-accepting chemotaxis protein [Agrobacterium]|uniref:HAMP domain-containing protein n=1 Tax=Agrobacterium tumefaciens TaxID=358 RepID=A0AAE6EID9_AGRTU|nr:MULTISPECIES: HAMP domain-containing methyl-accepting chemotaxis protein [Agrobacterium]QCL77043.1 HAMP domain-containing protein [Agrobacterium tumefaciens]QCL82550.1 HAMP domain-containing protein [Agrobacterium tumefaciens]CUX71079.1 Methyl-accepting chemotaxis protein [Agrobacterium sp. NCPPB 925]
MIFNIRNVLIGLFILVSVALAGLLGNSLLSSLERARVYTEVSNLISMDKYLFQVLVNVRGERGDSATALTLSPADGAGAWAAATGARGRVDAAMAQAIAKAGTLARPELRSALDRAQQIYSQFVSLRQRIDANIALPLAQREVGLDTSILSVGSEFLAALEAGSVAMERRVRSLDASQIALLEVRSFAWSARAFGGNATVILTGVVGAGRPLTEAELVKLSGLDASVAFAWKSVSDLVSHDDTPDVLKADFAVADNSYFKGQFAEQRVQLLADLAAGKPLNFTKDSWRTTVTAALGTIAAVASSTMDVLDRQAEVGRQGAVLEAMIYLAVFIITLAICVTGMAVIIFRVTRPISRLTSCMGELSSGNLAVTVPSAYRRDEIGEMARSVEVFREAGIRNKQLELDAATSREQAERDRVETQFRAEAEAEERLNQATGLLASGLRRLSSGDMVCEIKTPFDPQFESLRHDFNSSVLQLREALLRVGESVSTVNGGSQEVSTASDDLSRRTEQQAASLEETAAALEEITANVVSTSKRASEARDTVRHARNKADDSGKVVSDAVAAMERIERSSRQIGQIIGVIDEIAFQTNLLALNAGVEAARAGDAGKGFAVVAQEVRELAQRSANAAKEIKTLIGTSAVAVTEGVKLVADTGVGLGEIGQLVLSVSDHMEAIATAAQEQSAGLTQVNTAVNHMDQATQQNAAMVEEMNAAGAGLAQECLTLQSLLSEFQLGQTASVLHQIARRMEAVVSPMPSGAPPRPSVPVGLRPAVTTTSRMRVAPTHGNVAVEKNDWQEF